jgi:hypothetical protein
LPACPRSLPKEGKREEQNGASPRGVNFLSTAFLEISTNTHLPLTGLVVREARECRLLFI